MSESSRKIKTISTKTLGIVREMTIVAWEVELLDEPEEEKQRIWAERLLERGIDVSRICK